MKMAPVIAVVGPSGVGKDSVIQALLARAPSFERVRRVITRPHGEGGEDFDRVSDRAFQTMVQEGSFVLCWAAHGLHYGIPVAITDQRRRADAVLVNLSRAVLPEAQKEFRELIVISLTADPKVLAQRLAVRGRESAADQARRLGRATAALPEGLNHVIEVDNSGSLDATVETILSGLQPERAYR
ncbi:phosphonate metabolism protein/1,5-bisphosphokinase (PRPP-forming) PhnN [Ruegeria arenilitoris]|uniref:phosphonate metabolism protein/1,5-bisphosphokinase (PRPP-forming) PhnN n=1 Tax=Ruegeria arenilitoris TaxID=1173585 RepID=UPI00147B2B78|nr:phosphonate metabolism protein/1,5-bisphosphokinase (PRPP-forming) PhnN [Ruegeria arenilitoris]